VNPRAMKVGGSIGGGAILVLILQQLFAQLAAIRTSIDEFHIQTVQRLTALEAKHEFYHGVAPEAEAAAAEAVAAER